MKREKRFPTIIGLVLLLVAIIVSVILSGNKTSFGTKASGDCSPVNPQITNLTNNSADISFITTSTCDAIISINNQLVDDIRLVVNPTLDSAPTKVHYFQIKSLKESTSYTFSIISQGKTYEKSEYNFSTSKTPGSELPSSNIAWGRVLNPDLQTTSNAIVYLNIPGAAPLSSFISSNGNWSISLASSFNEKLTNWFTIPSTPIDEEIIVIADDGSATQITHNTSSNNPVPDIIIGKNSIDSNPVTANPGVVSNLTPVQTQKKIDIINPNNGEKIPSSNPDFFGSGPLNSKIIIEVHSDQQINGEVETDSSGTWHWSPPQNLTPGEHTITAKVQNPVTGLWESVTKTFTVLAADGSSIAYEASRSATIPSLTPSLTKAPSKTPTLIPTSTPVVHISPTLTLTPTPTTIVRTALPSVSNIKPPVTGNGAPTVVIIISALLLFIISFKFIK